MEEKALYRILMDNGKRLVLRVNPDRLRNYIRNGRLVEIRHSTDKTEFSIINFDKVSAILSSNGEEIEDKYIADCYAMIILQ